MTNAFKDFYKILGLTPDADLKAIKSAYRRLALKFHPDQNNQSEHAAKRFREITEAYETLSDPHQRVRYNNEYKSTQHEHTVFHDIFSGKTESRNRENGRDYRYTLEITFREAMLGVSKEIETPAFRTCSTCLGTGAKPGSAPQFCQACGGSGEINIQQGLFNVAKSCGFCKGKGRIIRHPCQQCQGEGHETNHRRLTIHVPPGTEHHSVLKYEGAGEIGKGKAGDLRIIIVVKPHPLFRREGNDIHFRLPITMTEAALGATLQIPTLDGLVQVQVAPGTASDKILRLKGKGVPYGHTRQRGDQLVAIYVEIPQELSQTQKSLLEKFAQLTTEHYPEKNNFLKNIKENLSV